MSCHLLGLETEADPVVHVPEPKDVVELAVHVHHAAVAKASTLQDLRTGRVPSRQVILALVRL